jgi:hypothetical protein
MNQDTHVIPQPPGLQLVITPLFPLSSSTAALNSAETNNTSPTTCPLLSMPLPMPPLSNGVLTTSYSPLRLSSTETNDTSPIACPPLSTVLSSHPSLPPKGVSPTTSLLPSIGTSTSLATILSSATEYFHQKFASKNKNKTRLRNFLRAIKGFVEPENPDPQTLADLLTPRSGFFDGSDPGPISRLQGLSQGHLLQTKHDVGHVLGVVYFAHEVEQMEKSNDLDLELKRGRGRGRRTATYKAAAEALGIEEKTVAIICKHSRKFMLLIGNGGPGSLQRWDKGVNSL